MTETQLLERVKADFGYPIITLPEVTDEFIKDNFLAHAIAVYYRAYPLQSHVMYAANTSIAYTTLPAGWIGILAAHFMNYFEYPGILQSDPFSLARSLVSIDSAMTRLMPEQIMLRQVATTAARPSYSIINDDAAKTLRFASQFDGYFNVIHGIRGDVTGIKINDEWDFVKVVSAYMKEYLYKTRTALDLSVLPIKLDFSKLKEEADKDLETIVGKRWVPYNFLLMWS